LPCRRARWSHRPCPCRQASPSRRHLWPRYLRGRVEGRRLARVSILQNDDSPRLIAPNTSSIGLSGTFMDFLP
jgi:hypothetical protein